MDTYRESCLKAKAIREGIVESRPVSMSKTTKLKEWLLIDIRAKNISKSKKYFESNYCSTLSVWGEYATEEVANTALHKSAIGSYADSYVIKKDLFESVYKPLWIELLNKDINAQRKLEENGLNNKA